MKVRLAIFLLVVSLLIAGCAGGSVTTPEKEIWEITLLSHSKTNQVYADSYGYYVYRPSSGYEWLLINLRLLNKTNTAQALNWLMDTFKFTAADGRIYSQRLQWNSPPGYLPEYYNPGQAKEGFIAFEVPLGTSAGELLWRPSEGRDVVFSLNNL